MYSVERAVDCWQIWRV